MLQQLPQTVSLVLKWLNKICCVSQSVSGKELESDTLTGREVQALFSGGKHLLSDFPKGIRVACKGHTLPHENCSTTGLGGKLDTEFWIKWL